MANSWLRLWHDMPNDPKWRTIARISKQPIALVQAVYIHLLVSASQNVTRGHADVTTEDLASALDVSDEDIEAIRNAMQGRVLEGEHISGWSARQIRREDQGSEETGAKSARQRKREQREREKDKGGSDDCHAQSRNVTTDKDKEEIKNREELKDKNTMSDSDRTADENDSGHQDPPAPENPESESGELVEGAGKPDPVETAFEEIFWVAGLRKDTKVKAKSAFKTKYQAWKKTTHGTPDAFATLLAEDIRWRITSKIFGTDKLLPTSYLNGERWNDEKPVTPSGASVTGATPVIQHGKDQVFVDYDALKARSRQS
ncbi:MULTISPECIES: hypothetical protein [unclassified Serratia (in: enterobacteria)]|uniref:hypothetical protein n=1 Tax=unclassified Serratia (in: enterobacteria) TaxID=2647522 RepID=UPI00046A52DE|nr:MULTISPECIES: hypothetical protein [unclassified Serratia (in: enterobacteria)]